MADLFRKKSFFVIFSFFGTFVVGFLVQFIYRFHCVFDNTDVVEISPFAVQEAQPLSTSQNLLDLPTLKADLKIEEAPCNITWKDSPGKIFFAQLN